MSTSAPWAMRLPVAVEFGAGSLERLPLHTADVRRVLVVTGRHAMRDAGVTDRLCAILDAAGVAQHVYDDLSAEPEHTEIEAAAEQARAHGAEAIIGCGGGSAMDAAKAVAVAATHPGRIMEYVVNGPRQITRATLPVIAVSSTSGTGSHVGRVAVLSDRAKGIKRALSSDFLYPRAAICDPTVLRTMPRAVTANSGFDAFAQALEGFLSRSEDPLGNLCAERPCGSRSRSCRGSSRIPMTSTARPDGVGGHHGRSVAGDQRGGDPARARHGDRRAVWRAPRTGHRLRHGRLPPTLAVRRRGQTGLRR